MAVWVVPIVAAAMVGVNKFLDKKLNSIKEEEEDQKRYRILADGVIPDLYQFYGEMDGVIERLSSREQEQAFCENINKLVEFMCHCKEPQGVPTVQNLVMMGMAAKNCDPSPSADPVYRGFTEALGEQLAGEIRRTSLNKSMAANAVMASAQLFKVMFPDELSSKRSVETGRRLTYI